MIVFVCKPNRNAVELGNGDLTTYLYRSPVDFQKAAAQHADMVHKIRENDPTIKLVDIADHLPRDVPLETLANLVFTRDPLIVTKRGIIIGRMKEAVRKEETRIWSSLLQTLYPGAHAHVFHLEDEESILEGGDFIMCQKTDTAFIATGTRSNEQAAMELMRRDLIGTNRVVLVYPSTAPDPDMHRIHLDCIMGIYESESCLLWEALQEGLKGPYQRYVDVYERPCPDREYGRIVSQRLHLATFLKGAGYKIIPVDTTSQKRYGCNILNLPNGKVMVQDHDPLMEDERFILVDLSEMHNMYGGIHCATQEVPERFLLSLQNSPLDQRLLIY